MTAAPKWDGEYQYEPGSDRFADIIRERCPVFEVLVSRFWTRRPAPDVDAVRNRLLTWAAMGVP
jgi:hypothetical protein